MTRRDLLAEDALRIAARIARHVPIMRRSERCKFVGSLGRVNVAARNLCLGDECEQDQPGHQDAQGRHHSVHPAHAHLEAIARFQRQNPSQ